MAKKDKINTKLTDEGIFEGTDHSTLEVGSEGGLGRLDAYLTAQFPDRTRNFFKKLIDDGLILLNEKKVKAGEKVSPGDKIDLYIPRPVESQILPQDIPLDILYEDDDLLVVNKPKGMVVHPAPGHAEGTLVNALMHHCMGSLSGINGEMRPGIVHRIDRDTTGALVVAKNDEAHLKLSEQIKAHSMNRIYVGFVAGNVKEDEGTVESTIGRHPLDRKKMAMNVKNGKDAVTHYRVLERFRSGAATYMEFRLETGRTHQIRVHMTSLHHPLLGDPVYGSGKNPYHLEGQALHARSLGFIHPRTGEYMEFEAPLPDYFNKLFNVFR
ncbi:MAG: RluA family pseudouridine synthase [Eubacterium sp.]|nr:RluA family pseudouridine synthase [Eubacterium sp.]